MPAFWTAEIAQQAGFTADLDQFMRLPVWVAKQQTVMLPIWGRWQSKYGKINWEPKKGDILQGVLQEHSPITRQLFTPRDITKAPLQSISDTTERYNFARVKRHVYGSKNFSFLRDFRDFRDKQLAFAVKDLSRQIGIGYDLFNRWQAVNLTPSLHIVGDTTGDELVANVPFGPANEGVAAPKGTSFWANMIGRIGSADGGWLNFRRICNLRNIMNDYGVPPWEDMPSAAPKENEIMKGKWLLTGEDAIYDSLDMDPHILNYKDYARDLLNSRFRGVISGNITFMSERFSMRFNSDGTLPDPEIWEDGLPLNAEQQEASPYTPTGNGTNQQVVPNPAYRKAPAGLASFEGYQPFETIKIGPPPEDFRSGNKMSKQTFFNMNWNGEVKIIDPLILQYQVEDQVKIIANELGEYRKLIADTVMGIIANTPRNLLLVLYRRNARPFLNQIP